MGWLASGSEVARSLPRGSFGTVSRAVEGRRAAAASEAATTGNQREPWPASRGSPPAPRCAMTRRCRYYGRRGAISVWCVSATWSPSTRDAASGTRWSLFREHIQDRHRDVAEVLHVRTDPEAAVDQLVALLEVLEELRLPAWSGRVEEIPSPCAGNSPFRPCRRGCRQTDVLRWFQPHRLQHQVAQVHEIEAGIAERVHEQVDVELLHPDSTACCPASEITTGVSPW